MGGFAVVRCTGFVQDSSTGEEKGSSFGGVAGGFLCVLLALGCFVVAVMVGCEFGGFGGTGRCEVGGRKSSNGNNNEV